MDWTKAQQIKKPILSEKEFKENYLLNFVDDKSTIEETHRLTLEFDK